MTDGEGDGTPLLTPESFGAGPLLRRSTPLGVASVIGAASTFVAGLFVARWLGPRQFGVAQEVALVYFLATLLRTGAFEGGVRAFVDLRAKGDEVGAVHAQNVATTCESIAAVVPGLLLFLLSYVGDGVLAEFGLRLAPIAVVLASLSSYANGLFAVRERFGVVARANALRGLLGGALLLAATSVGGVRGAIAAPVAADGLVLAYLLTRRPGLGVAIRFDRTKLLLLLRGGLPLGAVSVVYWAYRLVGAGSVAVLRNPREYAQYALAAAPIAVAARVVATTHTILVPAVWRDMSTLAAGWVERCRRITLALTILAGVATNLVQAVLPVVVVWFLPRYRLAASLLEVLAGDVILLSVAAVPSLLVTSARLAAERQNLMLWTGALATNAVANVVVLGFGMSITAVAVNDLWVQTFVVWAVFALARRSLARAGLDSPEAVSLLPVLPYLALTGVVGVGLHLARVSSGSGSWAIDIAIRTAVVAAVWLAAFVVSGAARGLRPRAGTTGAR